MIVSLSQCRRLMVLAVLALPGVVAAQSAPETKSKVAVEVRSGSDAKIAELEAKLAAMLKEIQALKGGTKPATASDAKEKKVVVVAEVPKATAGTTTQEKKVIVVTEASKTGTAPTQTRVLAKLLEDKAAAAGHKPVTVEIHGTADGKGTLHLVMPDGTKKTISLEELKKDPTKFPGIALQDLKGLGDKAAMWKAQVTDDNVVAPKVFVKDAIEGVTARIIKTESGDSVTLRRTTYQLPAEKAASLAAFLKEHAKAKVLEMTVEKDKLTVTTTPEVQHTISGLVALMQGKTPAATGAFHFDMRPMTPGLPVKPMLPHPPTPPMKKPDAK